MSDQYSIAEIMTELILPEIGSTIFMLAVTSVFSFVFGLAVAVVMADVRKDGLHPLPALFHVLEVITDLLMSMPFIVLAVALTPLTRMIVGTSIGMKAAIVPLTIVTTPVFAKFIYNALIEVNPYLIEAARSFGASDARILLLMVREAVPAIISGTTLSTVTTLGSVAMMGAIGAGGVGAIAIIYGYQRSNYTVIYLVVIVLAVFTQLVQMTGDAIYRKRR